MLLQIGDGPCSERIIYLESRSFFCQHICGKILFSAGTAQTPVVNIIAADILDPAFAYILGKIEGFCDTADGESAFHGNEICVFAVVFKGEILEGMVT